MYSDCCRSQDVFPKIFLGDHKSLQDIVYRHKFRHSFAVGLYDDEFTRTYYALYGTKFLSINYYRPRATAPQRDETEDEQKYDVQQSERPQRRVEPRRHINGLNENNQLRHNRQRLMMMKKQNASRHLISSQDLESQLKNVTKCTLNMEDINTTKSLSSETSVQCPSILRIAFVLQMVDENPQSIGVVVEKLKSHPHLSYTVTKLMDGM